MEKESVFDQMKKQMEEERQKELDQRFNGYLNPNVTGLAQAIKQEYRIPTLTERIETLERQVNHLMHLIGTKG